MTLIPRRPDPTIPQHPAPVVPRFECPVCRLPYMVAAMDAETEGRALSEWGKCCELPEPPGTEWTQPQGIAFAAVMTAAVALWVGLIAWLVTRL